MLEGPLDQLDAQLPLFEANFVVTIRKSWGVYQRHFCDTEHQYWQATGTQPFGVDNSSVTSPTGKSLAFTVPY